MISEFVDRNYWLADEVDRRYYLSSLSLCFRSYDGAPLAYGLMSSHVHWGLLAGQLALATLFRPAHTRYAAWWHRRHGGRGPVFANRPSNHQVRPVKLAELVAYIHMNPVRGRACQHPVESTWTSHRAYLRLTPAPAWLDVGRALSLCGFDDTAAGRRLFDEFVRSCETLHWQRDLVEEQVDALPQDLGAGFESSARPWPDLPWRDILLNVVSGQFDVTAASMCNSRVRRRPVSSARRVLTHIARDHCGLGFSQIAEWMGVTAGAVRQLAARELSAEEQRRVISALRDIPSQER